MKKVGIVGICIGGTSLFYPYFIRQAILQFNKKNPEAFIHQLPLNQVDDAFQELTKQNVKPLTDLILNSINQLVKLGVDLAVIPNNAAHTTIDVIQKKSPIPVVSLIDAVSEYCIKHKSSKILTLGSSWVMDQKIFQRKFEKHSMESISIDKEDQLTIHDSIMSAMVSGSIDQENRRKIITLIKTKKELMGCDTVIMACSDIVRALQDTNIGVKTINTMFVLADKVLASIGKEKPA